MPRGSQPPRGFPPTQDQRVLSTEDFRPLPSTLLPTTAKRVEPALCE